MIRPSYLGEDGPIALAEKVVALLGEGAFTATYKYAVLLGLIDLCLENTNRSGAAPDVITTRQLAEKIVEIYWPHCEPYHAGGSASVLRQSGGGRDSQAEVLRLILRFREAASVSGSTRLSRMRLTHATKFQRLPDQVEWKLIQMPLPRLQRFGGRVEPFLYQISWDETVNRGEVRRYQDGDRTDFDNRIHLAPGAGDDLVRLNGLLRPLIHRQWAALVARMNELEEARLQTFLFGAARVSIAPVLPALLELQENRCFYCAERITGSGRRRPHVDHFVPWSRYPNDALQNLVVAHESCNGHKSDYLAASNHVERWLVRLDDDDPLGSALVDAAARISWQSSTERTLSVTRAIYHRLPHDIPLWQIASEFAQNDVARVRRLLS